MTRWQPYPEYKDPGVEWLGEIPAHWETRRLKYTAVINTDTLPENTDPDWGLQYIDIGNVDSTGSILDVQEMPFERAPSRARRQVRHGDTIISTVRTYLKAIAYIDHPPDNLIVSTGFAVLRPRPELEPRYLWRLVQSQGFVDAVVAHSEGIGYPAIAPTKLTELPVWIPPIPEQRAIAAFLDRQTARLDALIAEQRRLSELLQERRAALISHAVTRGLDPDAPRKDSGIPWLGEIPVHWEMAPVWTLFELGRGRVISNEEIQDNPGPYHVYSSQTENEGALGRIDTFDFEGVYLTWTTDGANAGTVFYREGKFSCTNVCGTLRARKAEMEPRFFEHALNVATPFYVRHDINPKLMNNVMARIRVQLPPVEEQRAIAAYLDRETAKIDAAVAEIETGITQLEEYRTALISTAVTGKIDVRQDQTFEVLETSKV